MFFSFLLFHLQRNRLENPQNWLKTTKIPSSEVITAQLNIQLLDYLVYMCRIKFCSDVFLLFENFVFSICQGLKKLKWPKWIKLPNQTSISQYFWYTLENKFSLRIFVLLLIIFFLSRGDKKTKKLLKYKNLSVRGMGNILTIGQTLMILILYQT